MDVILGATGQVGSQVVNILLEAKKTVRVIGRSAERLAPLAMKGAIPLTGDIADTDFLIRALEGATGVFVMVPPNSQAEDLRSYQKKIVRSIADALKEAKVTRAFSLSCVGADLEEGTGTVRGHHLLEERLNKIKRLNIIHFRAACFMENILWHIGSMRSSGIISSSLRGDLPMPWTATKDIARTVADHLMNIRPVGKSARYLLGQRDLTFNEITGILAIALNMQELQYRQLSYDEAAEKLISQGVSPDAARACTELTRAYNEGLIPPIQRTEDTTTTTAFEEFAVQFAEYYDNAGIAPAAAGM